VDQFAILVAAFAHDLGHFGKTNAFLVTTKHELAIRYNDQSPLENMHCATLFAMCKVEAADIFSKVDSDMQRDARKIIIAAILHTDNANHFEMVKDITNSYAIQGAICTARHAKQICLRNIGLTS